ncbi:hypothetical protein K458DRAFT_421224 [Lentithecium fluviatile CBS 122367]|uniref:Uncharacterized protein n=1 Tax=Lentithecium fluviatile CBS 122367 TaxID=1168545 RepID=A0A6G1IRM7_9PLEO|nr:hypothetical protein K458DRAFT_421224 [Lentithecium fluviatile CBS 122367]
MTRKPQQTSPSLNPPSSFPFSLSQPPSLVHTPSIPRTTTSTNPPTPTSDGINCPTVPTPPSPVIPFHVIVNSICRIANAWITKSNNACKYLCRGPSGDNRGPACGRRGR